MFENIIEELLARYLSNQVSKETILNDLFENAFLKEKYVNEIRRSTNIWIIANEIFKRLWLVWVCKIMAIWDIEYFGELKTSWQNLMKNSLANIDLNKLGWYDLNWQWSEKLSDTLYNYMNQYYNFSDQKGEVINEIIPCYGATDGLVMILDALKQKYSGKKINFIYPEASFMASVSIAKTYDLNMIGLNKPAKNNFFITKAQIDWIKNELENNKNIYYFTTVWNPTWEKISENDLYEIMKYILRLDKNPIFILDNVYVGLLKKQISSNMFEKIFKDREIFERIIFCESLSKTLWTTGIRLAWIWTVNKELSLFLKKNIILKKAWYSKVLDGLVCNLLSNLEETTKFQEKEFEFISIQRINFLDYIKHNFSEFFDFESSSNVEDREGIYILLKVNPEYNAQYIFAETQIIWVSMKLSDWDYIRYSFGNTDYFFIEKLDIFN